MENDKLKGRGFELFMEREMCQNRIQAINQELSKLVKVMQDDGLHDAERVRADEDSVHIVGGPVPDDEGDGGTTE